MHATAFWRSPLLRSPRQLHAWLSERGSLTRRLMTHFPDFSVQVLHEGFCRAHLDERTILQIGSEHVATREVLLCAKGKPLVFAHSITARASLKRGFHLLGRIGSRPLGAVLFADPKIRRSHLAFCKIDRRHPLWQKAVAVSGIQPPTLWARRSVFYAGQNQLLITEVFLSPPF
ncbi:chorismate--pyruvate lyase family protein [Chitinibacter sp. S2-10]|uniref:chorismate--pyruvate lyase family protein n=1 Tax=Chitinibacter sp. S2-10 TaxID=3373597 RepID=UPI00397730AD